MCLAKPGPRCYGHADDRYFNAVAKVESIIEERKEYFEEIDNVKKEIGKREPSAEQKDRLEKLTAKNAQLREQTKEAKKKQAVRLAERDATKVGIETLKLELTQATNAYKKKNSYDNLERMRSVEKRLSVANDVYKSSLKAYDNKNGTVNGRRASPHGSREGIGNLRNSLDKVKVALDKAIADDDKDAQRKLLPKYTRLQDSLEHATDTYNRVLETMAERTKK